MSDKRTVKVTFQSGYGLLARGQELDADHPAVKRYPSMFESKVRTTAAVPGPVVDPGPAPTARPDSTARKAEWEAYVAAQGVDTDGLTKSELQDLADELEGG